MLIYFNAQKSFLEELKSFVSEHSFSGVHKKIVREHKGIDIIFHSVSYLFLPQYPFRGSIEIKCHNEKQLKCSLIFFRQNIMSCFLVLFFLTIYVAKCNPNVFMWDSHSHTLCTNVNAQLQASVHFFSAISGHSDSSLLHSRGTALVWVPAGDEKVQW